MATRVMPTAWSLRSRHLSRQHSGIGDAGRSAKNMANIFIKTAIRSLFTFMTREQVNQRYAQLSEEYTLLCKGLSDDLGRIKVLVPKMRGVDEEMRDWSFFEVLEHNVIVNRSITASVSQLAEGKTLSGVATIDPKKDVMPSKNAGIAIVEVFRESIIAHVTQVANLGQLRGTPRSQHPVFGLFNAHKWHCMFAFHLGLHLPQAKYIIEKLRAEQNSADNLASRRA